MKSDPSILLPDTNATNDNDLHADPAIESATEHGAVHDGLPPPRAHCSAADLLRWVGMPGEAGPDAERHQFATRRLRAGQVLTHENAGFDSLYFVCAGSFKCVQTDEDGYEQVLAFALRGDVLGLDGLGDGLSTTDVVALEDSTVAVLPMNDLLQGGRVGHALQQLLCRAVGRELTRRNRTLQLMSAVGAEVRVARFLLQTTARQAEQGFSMRRVRLTMSRREIASHLGVAHETVSRSLTTLADWGYIDVLLREIEILDRDGLEAFQRATRGAVDHRAVSAQRADRMPPRRVRAGARALPLRAEPSGKAPRPVAA